MSAKHIMVTGAAGGIGRSCAERLLAKGARVVALDRQEITWRQKSDVFLPLACDVSVTQDCRSAVERAEQEFGPLDGLIHCAAIHSSASWEQLEAEELLRVLNVNVGGSFLIAKAAGQAMQKRRTGSIVLTSSSNMITGGVGGAAGMGGPAYV